jgi:hypothetical protein
VNREDAWRDQQLLVLAERFRTAHERGKDPDDYMEELVYESFQTYSNKLVSWPPRLANYPCVLMSIHDATNKAIASYSNMIKRIPEYI